MGILARVVGDKMTLKPVVWIASTLDDLKAFPREVRKDIGDALRFAQLEVKHPTTKPLKGFGGAAVLEVITHVRGDAYRAVYTVKFGNFVYALHAFQKKSTRGIETPRRHLQLIRDRLKAAERDYRSRKGEK